MILNVELRWQRRNSLRLPALPPTYSSTTVHALLPCLSQQDTKHARSHSFVAKLFRVRHGSQPPLSGDFQFWVCPWVSPMVPMSLCTQGSPCPCPWEAHGSPCAPMEAHVFAGRSWDVAQGCSWEPMALMGSHGLPCCWTWGAHGNPWATTLVSIGSHEHGHCP